MKSVSFPAFASLVFGCLALGLMGCGESKEQLQTALADRERLQTRLSAAEAEVSSLKQEIAAARVQIAELTPWATKARTLPVRLSSGVTAGNTNSGYQLVSLSAAPLAIRIHLNNTNTQRSMTLTRVLPAMRPAAGAEIGAADGWTTATGDVVEMTSDGFDVLTKRF